MTVCIAARLIFYSIQVRFIVYFHLKKFKFNIIYQNVLMVYVERFLNIMYWGFLKFADNNEYCTDTEDSERTGHS